MSTEGVHADRIVAAVQASSEELLELTAQAVRAASVTGHERPASDVFAAWAARRGFDVQYKPVAEEFRDGLPAMASERDLSERPNLFVGWSSGNAEPPLVLNGHVDVVPAQEEDQWTHPPFSGTRRDGRIWGRGSADMKGGLAAAAVALHALRVAGVRPHRDVQLQCVMGEETGGLGTLSALQTERVPVGAIVLEPTRGIVASACGGAVQFAVEVDGRAAHTAIPWTGVSAMERLWTVYTALAEAVARRNAAVDHPLFARLPAAAPFGIGTFEAGQWRSTIPESARMSGRFGVLPWESIADVRALILHLVDEAARADPWLREHPPRVSWVHEGFPAWETPQDDPLVRALDDAALRQTGERRLGAVTYGSDAGHFATAGIPVVLFGPGNIEQAHLRDEYIDEHEIVAAAEVLALAVAALVAPKDDEEDPA